MATKTQLRREFANGASIEQLAERHDLTLPAAKQIAYSVRCNADTWKAQVELERLLSLGVTPNRSDVARRLGVHHVTASNVYNDLLAEGFASGSDVDQ